MSDQIMNILYILLALVIIWTFIKVVFKITKKIFTCGIGVIILIAGAYYLFSYLGF